MKKKKKSKTKYKCGVFQDIEKSGFFEQYKKLVERLQEKQVKGGKK